jgi:hypothetical protein
MLAELTNEVGAANNSNPAAHATGFCFSPNSVEKSLPLAKHPLDERSCWRKKGAVPANNPHKAEIC